MIFVNAFCNEAVAICCKNALYLWEKKFPCISQHMKKTWLINRFVKFFENYAPLSIFFFVMSSEPNYVIAHPHAVIPEALFRVK